MIYRKLVGAWNHIAVMAVIDTGVLLRRETDLGGEAMQHHGQPDGEQSLSDWTVS